MGNSTYDFSARQTRSELYSTQSLNDTFEQNKYQTIHDSMKPQGVKLRECRDSANHPKTVPVVLGMDVTGSMSRIPHNLVKVGLPTLMTRLINSGIPDAALLFLAVGDHISDRFPLQVGQFESGDAELDMWLTRTFLESGGGGNGGESYSLVWDFVNRTVKTDAQEKRNEKGFLITFGDEYFHKNISATALKEVYGDYSEDEGISTPALLDELKKNWHVLHIHIEHSDRSKERTQNLKNEFGDVIRVVEDYTTIPEVISQFILEKSTFTPEVIDDVSTILEKPLEI